MKSVKQMATTYRNEYANTVQLYWMLRNSDKIHDEMKC